MGDMDGGFAIEGGRKGVMAIKCRPEGWVSWLSWLS